MILFELPILIVASLKVNGLALLANDVAMHSSITESSRPKESLHY